MARSDSCIAAIFASTSRSPAARSRFARSSAVSSGSRSFIAARSSSVNPLDVFLLAVIHSADAAYLLCGFPFGHCEALPSVAARFRLRALR
jgi:hypothetical protein